MSQGADTESGGEPLWVTIIDGILNEKYDNHNEWIDLAWEVSEGMEDFQHTVHHVTHEDIALAFVIEQKKVAKANHSLD